MTKSILITGGARSGKSTFAEGVTLSLARPALYIATAEARDAEMTDRIARHQARRGADWTTLAEPLALSQVLKETDGGPPRLVDCLTLWLSNLMLAGHDLEAAVAGLTDLLPRLASPVVMVTNEVGWGIVPDNALARAFRDAAGIANQRVAEACDELWLCVAGQPLRIKP
ncbi:bifunctional adenosylcobinamide kinase/adenosylcobinamide-phosphate guanylyltransferase [Paracoccus angustae]|uniref:Bifunctional adenosylcobalamin biosynthesis protein n=1 Tax=Paracoccus angustae TaxID=1671480 RepID=A0ABV7U582_9RHOB